MAELSIFWETVSGTGDSNVAGYADSLVFQALRSFFSRTANLGGVAPDFQNELAVTGAASPLAVNTGAGMAYGIPYFNSASVSVTIPTPAAQTRIDRIVLRASWAAKTVRITRIAGTEGAAAPALTQTAGTTWDIPLAQVSITTGAVLTLTDQREWLIGVGDGTIDNTKLAANAVTTAAITDNAVTNAKLADMAANTVRANVTGATTDPTDVNAATFLAQYIHAATAKTPPVAADELALIDSAASNTLKKITYSNLVSALGGVVSGTFTPTYLVNNSATGVTYASRTGYYADMGTFVFIMVDIILSNKGAGSGAVTIGGLPIAVGPNDCPMPCIWNGTTTAYITMQAVASSGQTYLDILGLTAGSATARTGYVFNTGMANTSEIWISGFYKK